jgi:hypothetical protein
MATTLTVVKTQTPPSKPKRERIALIEATPKEEWFVRTTTPRGRVVWYLRFEVTGMNPRLFGPFSSNRDSLLFLDDAIDAMADFEGEVQDACAKRMVTEECLKIWPPLVEHPLLSALHLPAKKGR